MRRRVRCGLVATALVAGLAACGGDERAPSPPAPSDAASDGRRDERVSCGSKRRDAASTPQQPRLFAPDSVWNRPLERDLPLGEQRLAAAFRAQVQREIEQGIGPWIQT